MLYTRKGDDGTTYKYGCDQRFSKNSDVAEALGSLDEINSFLGICKVKCDNKEIVEEIQQNLFIIQAEVAGADKTISEDKIKNIEIIIDDIEKQLPEIKTFFVSGGNEESALFDFARTIARRAERRVVAIEGEVGKNTLAYLNRLSSLLYALARLSSYKNDIKEDAPTYE